MRRVAWIVLVVSVLSPALAGAQALRYTRPLEVDGPGWVRVPLGPEMLRRTSAGGGFELFGPEGEELLFRRLPARPRPLRRPVDAGAPVSAEDGWWIPLAVAPGARLHERLLIETESPLPSIEPDVENAGRPRDLTVRIEGSADGETWSVLVAGELRAVRGAEARYSVSYPATEVTRLRLFWPRSAESGETPRIVNAAVAEVPPGSSRLSLARPDCRVAEPSATGVRTVCRLPLGGAGHSLRHLCFLVTSPGPAGYRLLSAEEGRWEVAAEGVWGLPGEDLPRCVSVSLDLAGESPEAEALRLELYGAGDEAPTVREASAELAPEELVFRARRGGLHTLAYGPTVFTRSSGSGPDPGMIPPPSASARVEPGPEEATEVPIESVVVTTAVAPTPAVTWQESWPLTAEAPEPGQVFRLTLPESVYAVARPGLPDLRLLRADGDSDGPGDPVVGGASASLVPFARWRPEAPELAAERRGVAPRRAGEVRRATIEPAVRGLPLSALVVSAPGGPPGSSGSAAGFRRRVRVLYITVARPQEAGDASGGFDEVGESGSDADASGDLDVGDGVTESTRGVGPWVEWTCRYRPPLPCRATLALDETPAQRVIVEIDDRGESTLPAVDLELWRRRDVLIFPWPSAGASDGVPTLTAGAEGERADDVEATDPLGAQLGALLARPWQEARLVVEGAGGEGSGRLGRWAIALALVAAFGLLIFLLHRILGEAAAPRVDS